MISRPSWRPKHFLVVEDTCANSGHTIHFWNGVKLAKVNMGFDLGMRLTLGRLVPRFVPFFLFLLGLEPSISVGIEHSTQKKRCMPWNKPLIIKHMSRPSFLLHWSIEPWFWTCDPVTQYVVFVRASNLRLESFKNVLVIPQQLT